MSNTLRKINAQIAGIRGRTTGFREATQKTAVAIVEFAAGEGDGNVTPALALCAAVGFASDRVKLIQWFALAGISITYTSDVTKRRVGTFKVGAKGYRPLSVEVAKSNNYWEIGKDDDKLTEDMTSGAANDRVLKLAKYFQKRLDAGEVPANDIDNVKAKIVALRNVATVTAVAA